MTPHRLLILCVVAILTLVPIHANATIINVPTDASTIQAGINLAVNGDTVLVAPGVYQENINFRGKGITVAGHFLIQRDPNLIHLTTIDGSNPTHPDTASCVLLTGPDISTAQDSSAALIGLTLRGGTGTRWTDEHGAGVYREGGGILVQYLSPRIQYNIIEYNQATNIQGLGANHAGGGAIRCGDSSPKILNNVIWYNQGLYGGGIVLNYTGAMVKNNLIVMDSSGSAYGGGGGIWIYGNDPLSRPKIIENNTIANNLCGTTGTLAGGLQIGGANVTLHNNIIWGNQRNQINYQSGTLTVSYCDVQNGWSGTGNIDEDPLLADDFGITINSPCKDAGDPEIAFNDPEDPANPGLAMPPSMGTIRNDMGEFGGPGRSDFPDFAIGVKGDHSDYIPENFSWLQSFPNPFNSSTVISYWVTHPGQVNIEVYNLYGQLITSLVDQYQIPGIYRISWGARNQVGQPLGSGIYLCRLNSGGILVERKLVLIR